MHAGSLFYTDAFGDGLGREANIIGQVVAQRKPEVRVGVVTMHTTIGATRIVEMLSGEQLPRIC